MTEPDEGDQVDAPAEDSLARAAADGPALFTDEEYDGTLPGVIVQKVVDTRTGGFFFSEDISGDGFAR